MKVINRLSVMGVMAAFLVLMPAQAQECQSVMINSKAVALASPRGGSLVNFSGSGGQLDPLPLLETTIDVTGIPSRLTCVVLTFSAQADPADNYGVYQASIDGVPMAGHGTMMFEYGFPTPVVFDAVNQGAFLPTDPNRYPNGSNSRMLSYTFFASVTPGLHTIRVKVAACCSPIAVGSSPLTVRAASMVARW